jgi:acetyl/propionyl-CoA carboxylase alpha subunit
MGIKTVAFYSDADRHSMFVKEADQAYRIGAAPTNQNYLKMETILVKVKASGPRQCIQDTVSFLITPNSRNYFRQTE